MTVSGRINKKKGVIITPERLYELCDVLARQLEKGTEKELSKMELLMQEETEESGDFVVNEKDKVVNLTEKGVAKVEQFFHIDNLADAEHLEIQHNVILALRANYLMFKDKDYVVKDDEVLIVDEFTGRIMPSPPHSMACTPSHSTLRCTILATLPLVITTSFRQISWKIISRSR